MEASIREPNIKNFVRLLQCAAKYGDELCMHASQESWELSVTNSSKSAYCLFTLEPAFFSRYKPLGTAAQRQAGVKCQLLAKSVLGVLAKATPANSVERVDLRIVDPDGGLRTANEEEEEEEDDIRVAGRSSFLEVKLVYHHGIIKKHSLHLQSSEFLRVVVDPDSTPSGFLIAAKVLRDWLDHFTIAFSSSTGTNGMVKGDSHLAWMFTEREVRVKNFDTATTNTLSTEVKIDVNEFQSYEVVHDDGRVNLALPMREFKGTLQLAEQFNMDLDFYFSEATQPMTLSSRYIGLDRSGNEAELFTIFCAIATTSTEAFANVVVANGGTERERRGSAASVKPEADTDTPRRRKPSEAATGRAGSTRPRASLSLTSQAKEPPTVTVAGGIPQPPAVASQFQPAPRGKAEPLFQPAPSQMSQSSQSVRLTQQEVLDMAGMGDLDLEAMLDDADDEDLGDQAEAETLAPAAPADIPSGWEDIDFENARTSTQRTEIAEAQHGSRHVSHILSPSRKPSITRESSLQGLQDGPNRKPSIGVFEPTRSSRDSIASRSESREVEPASRPPASPAAGKLSRNPSEFKPDLSIFGGVEDEEDELEADEADPTQPSGRKFESLFMD